MALESLLAYSRFPGGWAGQAYNEIAFRHFLALEHKRAEQSIRSFVLVLVGLRKHPGMSVRISPALAGELFSGLELCVREVDFVGWYREARLVGAVLTQGADADTQPDVPRRVADRVTQVLGRRLPAHVAQRLQVRVLVRPKVRY